MNTVLNIMRLHKTVFAKHSSANVKNFPNFKKSGSFCDILSYQGIRYEKYSFEKPRLTLMRGSSSTGYPAVVLLYDVVYAKSKYSDATRSTVAL